MIAGAGGIAGKVLKEATISVKVGEEALSDSAKVADVLGNAKAVSQIDRAAFAKERAAFWKQEAQDNGSKYSDANIGRMEKGKPPIGPDGHPTELDHTDRTMERGVEMMSRSDHRLGENYKINHPDSAPDAD